MGKKHGEGWEGPEFLKLAYYYFNQDHSLKIGWLYDQSNWYYLAKTEKINGENYIGGERRAGWINDGSAWYYLRSSGAMATGWYQDGSTWYYLDNKNGDMTTGWFQVNGKWYYAYSSGALAVNTTVDGYYVNYNGEWVQ